jgi:hypothetical protein
LRSEFKYLFILCLFGFINPIQGQFIGGIRDGFGDHSSGLFGMQQQPVYCSGGNGDGHHLFTSGLVTLNSQALYCKGGLQDGISSSSFSGFLYRVTYCFIGGIKDGWSLSVFQGSMYSLNYFLGGQDDGSNSGSSELLTINIQDFYCTSGPADGFSRGYRSGNMQAWNYCLGGTRDGYHAGESGILDLGYGIWTGAHSNAWNHPLNWKHNTIPSVDMNAFIPSGTSYYPLLMGSLSINSSQGTNQCKRLDIDTGGQITIRNQLTVNGPLKVSGLLHYLKTTDSNFTILPGGSVTVNTGGVISIE